MTALRNKIILIGFMLFALWYGGSWAYRTQYREPRTKLNEEIAQFDKVNAQMEAAIKNWSTFVQGNQSYYTRSFPKQSSAAQSLYQHWLLELAKFCDMEQPQIESYAPVRAAFGLSYRFHLQGRISSDGLARFLYEFYYAPYLQRLVSMQIRPVENLEKMDVELEFQGIALYPQAQNLTPVSAQAQPAKETYPLADKMPQGYYKRLASGPYAAYASVANRSLLQYAKAGLDKADYTYITAINFVNGEPFLWLTDRTSPSEYPIEIGLNEKVKIGSFIATLVEVPDPNVAVFERDGQYWILSNGECLNHAYAVPAEAR